MNKNIFVLLLAALINICFSTEAALAQDKVPYYPNEEDRTKIDLAIIHHNNGEYAEAIAIYEELLKSNPDNISALYEISYSLYEAERYEESLEYALKGLEYDSRLISQFYVMAGNTLDVLNKPEESVELYKTGIEKFPSDYLLYYNLAFTYVRLQKIDEAENALTEAIKFNPYHASSHALLANVMINNDRQIESILLLLRFLVIESSTQRSKTVLNSLDKAMSMGVEEGAEQSINLFMSPPGEKDSGVKAAEMIFRMARAARYTEENKGKSEIELRLKELSTLLAFIDEADMSEKLGGINNYLLPYYVDLKKNDFAEVLVYYTHQHSGLDGVEEWLADNAPKVDAFMEWNKNYKWDY